MAPPQRDDKCPRCGAVGAGEGVGPDGCGLCIDRPELIADGSDEWDDADGWDDADYGQRESCWHCLGAGGFHDCGEDCCACAETDLNETCPECGGKGWL